MKRAQINERRAAEPKPRARPRPPAPKPPLVPRAGEKRGAEEVGEVEKEAALPYEAPSRVAQALENPFPAQPLDPKAVSRKRHEKQRLALLQRDKEQAEQTGTEALIQRYRDDPKSKREAEIVAYGLAVHLADIAKTDRLVS